MHPVDDAGHHAEVVRDQDDRRVGAVLDALEHLEHLRLDRHVERGRRLVGDEQRRGRSRSTSRSSPAGASRRSTRAGTGRRAALGFGMPTMSSSSIARARSVLVAHRPWWTADRLGDLVADRVHGVQRGERVLEDHRDLRRRGASPCPSRTRASSDSPRKRMSPVIFADFGQQPEDRQRRHALARSGLPHDADASRGRATSNVTLSTAWTTPSSVVNSTDEVPHRRAAGRRSRRSRGSGVRESTVGADRRRVTSVLLALRVERVAQTVTDEVHARAP